VKPAEKILDLIETEDYGKAYPGRNRHKKPGWSRDPFHILIATVLSQRTRDQNTFLSSTRLFSEYDTPKEIAAAPLKKIEELIRPSGFPSAKAKAIKEISRRLA
jgi:endonuclease III